MLCRFFVICLVLSVGPLTRGQSSAYRDFDEGYRALAQKDYDTAIAHFRTGLAKDPGRVGMHKDLAYTLLKTGDNTAARDEFEAALALSPKDEQAGLEYAFLANETGKPVEAKRTFDKLRRTGSSETKKIAERAFQNIDQSAASQVIDPPQMRRSSELSDPDKALADLGLSPRVQSSSLSAFFDASYRSRADIDYLAKRWRAAGISSLYVAAWHNMEPDRAADGYLLKLIEACHRNAILVYAWLDLPYVSEKFWNDYPDWREKTASGRDAQIGWRKLMNLQNPECSRAAAEHVKRLLDRFDWDGVNFADAFFEPSQGISDPAQFTPMNGNVRAEFKEIADFDPKSLFDPASAHSNERDRQAFLQFRTVLAARVRSDWSKNLENSRKSKPYLDILSETFVLDVSEGKLTGMRLLQTLHEAARSSRLTAIYAENFIDTTDLSLLGASATLARVIQHGTDAIEIDSPEQTRLVWEGPAAMDGQPWPVQDDHYLLVPSGHHRITGSAEETPLKLTDFNGQIQSATVSKAEVDIAYRSQTRALVAFDKHVAAIELDGAPFWKAGETSPMQAVLPAGQHLLTFIPR
jgi:tetratricopeptide (TPR) repeat protein